MIHQFSTGPPNDHSCKVTIQLASWFLTRFLKFQPMRTHYGPWQPCWISNQHQKQKSGRGPSNEHFWKVWLKSVQRFQRRRFKCEKLTDGRTEAYPGQKLTWPMARWAKKWTFNTGGCMGRFNCISEIWPDQREWPLARVGLTYKSETTILQWKW